MVFTMLNYTSSMQFSFGLHKIKKSLNKIVEGFFKIFISS